MTEPIVRPDLLETEYLVYLDGLRETGVTNMFGAAPYLAEEYSLKLSFARQVLSYWMKTFEERHQPTTGAVDVGTVPVANKEPDIQEVIDDKILDFLTSLRN